MIAGVANPKEAPQVQGRRPGKGAWPDRPEAPRQPGAHPEAHRARPGHLQAEPLAPKMPERLGSEVMATPMLGATRVRWKPRAQPSLYRARRPLLNASPPVVAATTLNTCDYSDQTHKLWVRFIAATYGDIVIYISPFTGDGVYQATADGSIDVAVTGDGTPSMATASGPPLQACTITVQSNFESVQIPQTGDEESLDIVVEVACPNLVAGGVCDDMCTLDPGTFTVAVRGCTVHK